MLMTTTMKMMMMMMTTMNDDDDDDDDLHYTHCINSLCTARKGRPAAALLTTKLMTYWELAHQLAVLSHEKREAVVVMTVRCGYLDRDAGRVEA